MGYAEICRGREFQQQYFAGHSAAKHGRVLLTHDVATITHYAYERIRRGEKMPGVFEVNRQIPLAIVIEDILLLAELSVEEEWENQVCYLPLATGETT